MRLTKMSISAFLLICMATANPAFASTIAQIDTLTPPTPVTLDSNPVITVIGSAPGTGDGYTYTNYLILVQDTTGSIALFGQLPTGDAYIPSVGDEIGAAGLYDPFRATLLEIEQLTSLTQVSVGNAVPAPRQVTAGFLNEQGNTPDFSIDGAYLSLQDVEFSGASGNFPTHANGVYTVTDLSGNNPVTVYLDASSYSASGALGGTAIPTGPVDMTGIVENYGIANTLEFIPFSITADTASAPEPSSMGLLLGGVAALGLLRLRRFVA